MVGAARWEKFSRDSVCLRSGLWVTGGSSRTSLVFNLSQLLFVFPSGGLGGHVKGKWIACRTHTSHPGP